MTSKAQWNIIHVPIIIKVWIFIISLICGATTIYAQDPIHDPSTIIKGDDNRYYLFSTGDGVYSMSSSNPQFTDYRRETSPLNANNYPAWIDNYVQNFEGNFWAPDVILMDGYYYVYYSASSFGSSSSTIGVVRTPSLANPQWEDLGMVVHSDGSRSDINAIDPALFEDSDGKIWMSYGSFFGGIGLVEIDRQTGKTKGSINHIAGGNHQAYEA
ncbi:MAG TPA: family 43 glycosylhydrolase, partial [Prolixibacteraceae bacterium]|nr:family 43 glycosylhydrolase [Prolixibacteraceae bacterium]